LNQYFQHCLIILFIHYNKNDSLCDCQLYCLCYDIVTTLVLPWLQLQLLGCSCNRAKLHHCSCWAADAAADGLQLLAAAAGSELQLLLGCSCCCLCCRLLYSKYTNAELTQRKSVFDSEIFFIVLSVTGTENNS